MTDLARQGWPQDTGAASSFVQLYDDLSSKMSDTQYAEEASSFTSANCSGA